jgi:hypothetical protein
MELNSISRNAAALHNHCKRIARDPTSIDGFSVGTIPEDLGQNCVLYTSAVNSDTAVVILAKKHYLYSYSVCLGICVTPPIQLCYLPTVLRRW